PARRIHRCLAVFAVASTRRSRGGTAAARDPGSLESGARDVVQPLDLRRRHARKALDPQQRVRIGKRPEGGAVHLDRRTRLLSHPLPDATRLKNRDAVTDDEGTGGLVGRVKEYRTKIGEFSLQAGVDGVGSADVD